MAVDRARQPVVLTHSIGQADGTRGSPGPDAIELHQAPKASVLKKLLFGIAGILGLVLAVGLGTFRLFNVPSGSNLPTLRVGEYILTWRFAYGVSARTLPLPPDSFRGRLLASNPQQGDMGVFATPKDGRTIFVKRVIGLPGDRVQMRQGRLFINGTVVPREQAGTYLTKDEFGQDKQVPKYVETLPNGSQHEIIEIQGDGGYYDNTAEYVVPQGSYFLMGDNRDNSDDSRNLDTIGYIPADNFVAKAWRILVLAGKDEQRQFKIIQ